MLDVSSTPGGRIDCHHVGVRREGDLDQDVDAVTLDVEHLDYAGRACERADEQGEVELEAVGEARAVAVEDKLAELCKATELAGLEPATSATS